VRNSTIRRLNAGALLAGAVLAGCGVGTMPARYPERPLLVPDDEHQLSLAGPLGFGDTPATGEGGWRFGLGPGVNWEFPVVFAFAPVAPEDPPFVFRVGWGGITAREDEVGADDPRQPPRKRLWTGVPVRSGVAGRLPLAAEQSLVAAGTVERFVNPHRDSQGMVLALSWLWSPASAVSFAPAVRFTEGVDEPFEGRRTRTLGLGGVGTDGSMPYALVAWHAASFLDVGLGGVLYVDLEPGLQHAKVSADATFLVEFRWD
jgi:hypothetical protein